MMMCTQTIYNWNQANFSLVTGPAYLMHRADSHNRENENCTYSDGVGKRLSGVSGFSNQLYQNTSWTWQLSGTQNTGGFWWTFADSQY